MESENHKSTLDRVWINIQHTQFLRLLHKCETNFRSNETKLNQPRLKEFLKSLETTLNGLETYQTTKEGNTRHAEAVAVDQDEIQNYRLRVEKVKELVSRNLEEPRVASSQNGVREVNTGDQEPLETVSPVQPAETSAGLPSNSTTQRPPRSFQFRKPTSQRSASHRLTKEEQQQVHHQKEVQRYLAAELSEMASQLKDGSLAINQTLRSQNKVLEETEKAAIDNQENVSKEGTRLQKYLSSQGLGICEVIFLVLMVCAAFIFAYMFIKIFPKRQRLISTSARTAKEPMPNTVLNDPAFVFQKEIGFVGVEMMDHSTQQSNSKPCASESVSCEKPHLNTPVIEPIVKEDL